MKQQDIEVIALIKDELVYLKNDEAVCDSLQVAQRFGKRHEKLIHEIERMYGDLIGKLDVRNGGAKMFQKSLYENRGKQYPMYLMNRDGFSLLVMGFTGKKALEWKLEYIKAFNKMESIFKRKIYPDMGGNPQNWQTYQKF